MIIMTIWIISPRQKGLLILFEIRNTFLSFHHLFFSSSLLCWYDCMALFSSSQYKSNLIQLRSLFLTKDPTFKKLPCTYTMVEFQRCGKKRRSKQMMDLSSHKMRLWLLNYIQFSIFFSIFSIFFNFFSIFFQFFFNFFSIFFQFFQFFQLPF
jgi:hypothetical protein